VTYRSLRT